MNTEGYSCDALLLPLARAHYQHNEAAFHNAILQTLARAQEQQSSITQQLVAVLAVQPAPYDASQLHLCAEIRMPQKQWHMLLLSDAVQHHLEAMLDEWHHTDYLAKYGLFPKRRSVFTGPAGCGKRASVEALAQDKGLPLLTIDLASLNALHHGNASVSE